jgi:hypothetical protein
MNATVTCNGKGAVLKLGHVEFGVREGASFEIELAPEALLGLVVLDESARAILQLLLGGAAGSPRRGRPPGRPPLQLLLRGAAGSPRRGRPPGRSPKTFEARPTRRSKSTTKRTGVSIWSGTSSFNPRWSNLKPEEIQLLGVNRLEPSLWTKVRDTIKGLDKVAWQELRPKWESKLRKSAMGDDKTLAADWRAFVGAAQKSGAGA